MTGTISFKILNQQYALTETEQRILDTLRKMEWGKLEIVVQNGKPVMVSEKKDYKLS